MNSSKIYILLFILLFTLSVHIYNIQSTLEHMQSSKQTGKILHLVLYSSDKGGPYDKMKNITQPFYDSFSNVTTVYYHYDPSLTQNAIYQNGILSIRGKETYQPGILDKTLFAFEYFRPHLDEYDYVIRSNISTVVRMDVLTEELNRNPVDYGCTLCFQGDLPYSSGTCIILSRYCIKKSWKMWILLILH